MTRTPSLPLTVSQSSANEWRFRFERDERVDALGHRPCFDECPIVRLGFPRQQALATQRAKEGVKRVLNVRRELD